MDFLNAFSWNRLFCILIHIPLKYVRRITIDNKSTYHIYIGAQNGLKLLKEAKY